MTSEAIQAFSLLTAEVVRERAHRMLAIGLDDQLLNFRIDLDRLDAAVDVVLAEIRSAYPTFEIPFHSRWRHFIVNGIDRWAVLSDATNWQDHKARARAEFDLAIISVLLDAGAGSTWRYRDSKTGADIGRSEGLALASLDMFAGGVFSNQSGEPLRVDAEALMRLSIDDLRRGFQVTDNNPLLGIEGRLQLLRHLGALVFEKSDVFARCDAPRPGGFFDHLLSKVDSTLPKKALPATTILVELLRHLGPIWPSRITLGGVPLGDCWRHPLLVTEDSTSKFVPLHKLSQWLSYSLIEPIQRAGLAVKNIDGLTGLSEYRNGGLFVDASVLAFKDPADARRIHDIASPLVVEWRALTVALLDRLAYSLRQRLGLDAHSLPLAKILEGGTWAAGRAIARRHRSDGSPPIKVISDGTVF